MRFVIPMMVVLGAAQAGAGTIYSSAQLAPTLTFQSEMTSGIPDPGDRGVPISLARFDDANGLRVLKRVTITMRAGTANATQLVLISPNTEITLAMSVSDVALDIDTHTMTVDSDFARIETAVSAPGAPWRPSNPLIEDRGVQTRSGFTTLVLDDPEAMRGFVGTEALELPVRASAWFRFQTSTGNGRASTVTMYWCEVVAIYDYEDALPVPEPALVWSAGLALLGGLGIRYCLGHSVCS